LRLSGEGRVAGLLELGRWDVAEARVKPTSLVPVDPTGGREFDVGERIHSSIGDLNPIELEGLDYVLTEPLERVG
jgi:hypothetical protein